MTLEAILGIEERDTTDERMSRKALAGQMWAGWPGLVRTVHVNTQTGVVTLTTDGKPSPEHAAHAGRMLTDSFGLPIRVTP